jgi:hypothetical protein
MIVFKIGFWILIILIFPSLVRHANFKLTCPTVWLPDECEFQAEMDAFS